MLDLYSVVCIVFVATYSNIRTVEGICDSTNALGLSPTVQTSSGTLQGLSCVSIFGRPYFSFRKIPFAAPPIGDLRFRAPRPPQKWEGVLNATEEAPACVQPINEPIPYPISFSEDCLFINVHTPYLKNPSGKLLPVYVFMYGDLFYKGSGTTYQHGPDFLLEKDVILVTFNYRLGILGFLNMNVPEAQGNAAMKDQVEALRWIQREISTFGGDPNLVTIAGESAAAECVFLLYVSPMARGLFSRVVAHSSPAIFPPSTRDFAIEVASSLKCPLSTPQEIVACLRSKDVQVLLEKEMMFQGALYVDEPFVPTFEEDHGEEVFLKEDPWSLIPDAPPIPFLMGMTDGESLDLFGDPKDFSDDFSNTTALVMELLPVEVLRASPSFIREAVPRIDKFYFGNTSSLTDKVYACVDYRSDAMFDYLVVKKAQAISVRAPVYLYYFTFLGDFQEKKFNSNRMNITFSRVDHGADIGYFFYRNYTLTAQNNLTAHPRDMKTVDTMTTLWTNFAKYGNPTPGHSKTVDYIWLPVEGDFAQYLHIDDNVTMVKSSLIESRVDFWDNLMKYIDSPSRQSEDKPNYVATGSTLLLLVCVVMFGIGFAKMYLRRRDYIVYK